MSGKTKIHSVNKDVFFSWFKVILISVLLLSGSSYYLFSQLSSTLESLTETRSFILTITITYENRSPQRKIWNLTETERAISLFMNNSWQTVYVLNASYPISEIRKDDDGNPIAYLSFPESIIPSEENLTYQISYRIILKPHSLPVINENNSGSLNDIPRNLKSLYCRDDGPWQMTRKEIRDLAFRIRGNETNVLTLLKRYIQWIKGKISYRAQDLPQYPLETLNVESGDCDDQANLLIAFCRTVGIPAYLQIGCIYLPGRDYKTVHWDKHWILRLTRIGWHGWAMVYVPPWGWLPVDLTYAPGVSSNPMNAIRKAAVAIYPVAQYANITETDYIAYSRSYRKFLLSNGFRIYESNVMSEETERYSQREGFRLPRLYIFVCSSVFVSSIVRTSLAIKRLFCTAKWSKLANAYK